MAETPAADNGAETQIRPVPIWLVVLVLTLAALFAYRTSFRGTFVLDDIPHIVENPWIRTMQGAIQACYAGNRPLLYLSLAANYRLGGLNPFGYHVVNLAIHLAAGLVLFGLVGRTLRLPGMPGRWAERSGRLALVVALIWLVHPLQTQSVTYLVQRCESLMGLCYLLCLYCVVRGSQSRCAWGWYLGAIFAGLCGTATKEIMVTAPIVTAAYDRIFLSRSWRELLARRGWLYAALLLMAFWLILPVLLPRETAAPASAGFDYAGATWWEYLRTQPAVLVDYLRLALWPDRLCLDYMWPVAQTWPEIMLPGALIFGLLVLTVSSLWRCPRGGFLGAAFFLILAPTSSIMPIADLAVEHRMYLPLAAVVVAAVLIVDWLIEKTLGNTRPATMAKFALVLLATVALALRTSERNRDYADGLRMWAKVVQVAPHNYRGQLNLGIELGLRGRTDEEYLQYQRVLELNPNYDRGHMNLAIWLAGHGRDEEAIMHFREAIRLRPNYPKAYTNLGNIYARRGELELAERHYRKSLEIDPKHIPTHLNLAEALRQQGRSREAAALLRDALALVPDLVAARLRLAWILATDTDAGVRDGREALQFVEGLAAPGATLPPDALDVLAAAYAASGRFPQAVDAARRAIAAARAAGDEERAGQIESRLQLYEQGRPFVEDLASVQARGDGSSGQLEPGLEPAEAGNPGEVEGDG